MFTVQAEQTEGGVTEGGEDQDGAEARGSEENEESRRPGEIQFTSMFEHVGTVFRNEITQASNATWVCQFEHRHFFAKLEVTDSDLDYILHICLDLQETIKTKI